MEQVIKIVPLLWEIIGNNKKGAANVTSKENEIIVSLWSGKQWKRFRNRNADILMSDIKASFQRN